MGSFLTNSPQKVVEFLSLRDMPSRLQWSFSILMCLDTILTRQLVKSALNEEEIGDFSRSTKTHDVACVSAPGHLGNKHGRCYLNMHLSTPVVSRRKHIQKSPNSFCVSGSNFWEKLKRIKLVCLKSTTKKRNRRQFLLKVRCLC